MGRYIIISVSAAGDGEMATNAKDDLKVETNTRHTTDGLMASTELAALKGS